MFHGSSETTTDSSKVVIKPYSIQIGAFKDVTRAQKALSQLKDIPGVTYIVEPSGKSTYYQVRIGYFNTVGEARMQAEALMAKKKISNYFITKSNPPSNLPPQNEK
jgi:cell division septation protein DedD